MEYLAFAYNEIVRRGGASSVFRLSSESFLAMTANFKHLASLRGNYEIISVANYRDVRGIVQPVFEYLCFALHSDNPPKADG